MENPFPQQLIHQNPQATLRSAPSSGPHGQRGSFVDFGQAGPDAATHSDLLLQQQQSLASPQQGPLPVPAPPGVAGAHGANGNGLIHGRVIENGARQGALNSLEFSRSPPGSKNTSHVPCKFFRSGTCQAGNACPFSHNLEPQTDVPCKYFAKGNCKFGPKCALAHVLPDGRRVNRPQFDMGADVRYKMGGRPSSSALPDAISHPGLPAGLPARSASYGPLTVQEDYFYQQQPQHKQFSNVGVLDAAYISPPGSNYGSPPGEGGRLLHLSPSIRAIDAPLPASFDSQGISHFARYGPSAASVPSRFGINPITGVTATTSTATPSAFGNLNSIARHDPVSINRNNSNVLASSPPVSGIDAFPRKILHSETHSKPQISSSLPAPYFGDEEYDEGLLPNNIRDLWSTAKPSGRRSLDADENESLSNRRHSTSGFASPADSKVGSPSNASPNPSRFGQFFAQRQTREDSNSSSINNSATNELGHVGSPLRRSSLNPDSMGNLPSNSTSIRASLSRPRSRDVSPFGMSSPPMRAAAGPSMLSQQFGSLRMASDSESNLRPALIRNAASNSATIGIPASVLSSEALTSEQRERARLYRVVSNSSIGRNDVIEEEPEICLFSMEEEEALERERARKAGGSSGPDGGGGGGSGLTGSGSDSGRPSVDSLRGGSDLRKDAWNMNAAPSGNTSVSANDSSAKSSPGSSGGGGLGFGVIGGGRAGAAAAAAAAAVAANRASASVPKSNKKHVGKGEGDDEHGLSGRLEEGEEIFSHEAKPNRSTTNGDNPLAPSKANATN